MIVTLEWTQISPLHFYNVSVIPSQSVKVIHDGRTRVQLTLSYNTPYLVSVVARHLCGQTYRATNFTELYYSRLTQSKLAIMLIYLKSCIHTAQCKDIEKFIDEGILAAGHSESPALEGTSVLFSCPPGLVLAGLNTTTCMGNGEWEPDPNRAKCFGKNFVDVSVFPC